MMDGQLLGQGHIIGKVYSHVGIGGQDARTMYLYTIHQSLHSSKYKHTNNS